MRNVELSCFSHFCKKVICENSLFYATFFTEFIFLKHIKMPKIKSLQEGFWRENKDVMKLLKINSLNTKVKYNIKLITFICWFNKKFWHSSCDVYEPW